MTEEKEATKPTASAIDRMKREAKAMRKAHGVPHHAALEQVAKANGYASWRAVTQAAIPLSQLVVVDDVRRPGVLVIMEGLRMRWPSWSNERVVVEAKGEWERRHRAVGGATPPVGTPGRERPRGNSTPAAAPVAGVWKSERVGERGSAK